MLIWKLIPGPGIFADGVYTKLGRQRMKEVYEFREDEGWDYTKSGDISDES